MNSGILVKFAYAFGIPAIIAIYMVWYFTQRMDGTVAEMYYKITIIEQQSVRQKEQDDYRMREIERLQNTITRMCVNVAQTRLERENCFMLPPSPVVKK